MPWYASLEGSSRTAEFLAGEPTLPDGLTVDAGDPCRFRLALPELDGSDGSIPDAVLKAVEARVQAINSFGRLRWGRGYEGLEVVKFASESEEGKATSTSIVVGSATFHAQPEQWAEMMELQGQPRPEPPKGYEE